MDLPECNLDFDHRFLEEDQEDDEAVETLAMELASTSSEEDEDNQIITYRGSQNGRRKNKPRDFPAAYAKVVKDYFNGADSTYDENDFERRFRVPRAVFDKIHDKLMGQHPFVGPLKDAVGKPGIYPLVRLVACFRHLAYGDAYDREDEGFYLSEDSVRTSVQAFCHLMAKHFPEHLNRCPTRLEKEHILAVNATRGFPGAFASWDCKPQSSSSFHPGSTLADPSLARVVC